MLTFLKFKFWRVTIPPRNRRLALFDRFTIIAVQRDTNRQKERNDRLRCFPLSTNTHVASYLTVKAWLESTSYFWFIYSSHRRTGFWTHKTSKTRESTNDATCCTHQTIRGRQWLRESCALFEELSFAHTASPRTYEDRGRHTILLLPQFALKANHSKNTGIHVPSFSDWKAMELSRLPKQKVSLASSDSLTIFTTLAAISCMR